MDKIKKKVSITGKKVQNIGYRLFLLNNGLTMDLSMLNVKNLKKDDQKEKIEIYIGGEKDKIDKFVEFIRYNFPEKANIDDEDKDNIKIEDYDKDIMSIESFYKILSVSQLYKFANSGTDMVVIQKEISESIRGTANIQKEILESIRETANIQKDIKNKITRFSIFGQEIVVAEDEIKNKIDEIQKDLKGYIDKKIDQLESKMEIAKRP